VKPLLSEIFSGSLYKPLRSSNWDIRNRVSGSTWSERKQVPGMNRALYPNIATAGGQVHRLEDWGSRQLAYPNHKVTKAHLWCLMKCWMWCWAINEVTTAFRFNDGRLFVPPVCQHGRSCTEASPWCRKDDETRFPKPNQADINDGNVFSRRRKFVVHCRRCETNWFKDVNLLKISLLKTGKSSQVVITRTKLVSKRQPVNCVKRARFCSLCLWYATSNLAFPVVRLRSNNMLAPV